MCSEMFNCSDVSTGKEKRLLGSEDGVIMLLRNAGNYLPVDLPSIPSVLNPEQYQLQNPKSRIDINGRICTAHLRHFLLPPRGT